MTENMPTEIGAKTENMPTEIGHNALVFSNFFSMKAQK